MISDKKKIDTVRHSAGKGRHRIFAEAKIIGNDVLVSVWGGTQPHIGSIAVSLPRPSLADPVDTSVTTSVFNFAGHKDDIITTMFAEKIAVNFNCKTVTTAGIHVENLKKKDLDLMLENAENLCLRLIEKMGKLN